MERIMRVVVVDDSAYVRKVIKEMLSRSPLLEVVGTARDGEEALEVVEKLQPDVVTLDLIMPRMDGVAFLRTQMVRRPLPVVIVSITSENGEMMLRALDAGAVDMIQKPTALASDRVLEIADELIAKVRSAGQARVQILEKPAEPLPALRRFETRATKAEIIVIGVSTGGPQALKYLLPQLPADFPVPIAVVIHMPVGYTDFFARNLNEISPLDIREAKEAEALRPGSVMIAPAGQHLTFRRLKDGSVVTHLDLQPSDSAHRPAADIMFQSAAEVFGSQSIGVVMTGMGSDGTKGAAWIKAQGGLILTEAEESCVVYGMPRSVMEAGLSDRSIPLSEMARAILESA